LRERLRSRSHLNQGVRLLAVGWIIRAMPPRCRTSWATRAARAPARARACPSNV